MNPLLYIMYLIDTCYIQEVTFLTSDLFELIKYSIS